MLALEASAFAHALDEPSAQQRYLRLAAAAKDGSVGVQLVASLETMLELVFERGRPSNRAVLQSVYARTPRGRQLTAAAREVNQALRTLRGQALHDVHIAAGPGRHTLVLETDRVRLMLELDASGARVVSLETG